ncbi:MAG: DUF814 domain-containing protein [Ignavibacteria bacterium]|nr:DUF814 domain-containing protein [Ignavibacteria bacterium]
MIVNYYTLRHIARDLDMKLAGAVIEEAFCQTKNEVLFSLMHGKDRWGLMVSCEPATNFVFLRGEVHRAKKNSVDVLARIRGSSVERVFIQPADREILLHCSNDQRVIIQLFGSKANILLVNNASVIVDAFLHRKDTVGARYMPRDHDLDVVPHNVEEFTVHLLSIGNVLLSAAVKKLFPLLNGTLIREACYRANLREQQLVAELGEKDRQKLYTAILELIEQLEAAPAPRIYHQAQPPAMFSTIPLTHIKPEREEGFDSIHDGIKTFLGTSRKQKSFLEEKEKLIHFLEQGIDRAERTLQKITVESRSLERASRYELFGRLLMTHLHRVEPRKKQVDVENIFSPSHEMVSIPLETNLSPAKNAEKYFQKAKKARAGAEEKARHKEETEEQWERLRDLLAEASAVQSSEQMPDFMVTHEKHLALVGYGYRARGANQEDTSVPFRTFTVAGGFLVWVGKSSENNDLLTMKYARPKDLWFHARASSGSHVVLRMGTGKGEPSKKAIDEAAGIAAFYSKMRNAKHVPVAMTLRKYVRKPKGAPPGTVTVERERLLFVEPRLPGAAQQSRATIVHE